MNFNKIKLSTKLNVGFSLMCVLIIGVSLLSIVRLNQINRIGEQLVDRESKKLSLIYDMRACINEISVGVRNIAISNDGKYMEEQSKAIDKNKLLYKEKEKQLGELIYTEKGKKLYKDIQNDEDTVFFKFDNSVKEGKKADITNEEKHT